MKRLFLWLWFVTGACFPVSVFFLNHIPDGIYTPVQDRVFVQQVRGQVYALRSGLAGTDADQQRERLQQWQPHYGIALTLLDKPPALDAQEQVAVKADGFIVRDQYQQVLLPIEGSDGRWLHLRLPGAVQMTTYMTIAAYLSILLLVGASLYAWVRLLWRDRKRCACTPTASALAICRHVRRSRHARRSGSSSTTPTAWRHAWPNWCSASAT